MSTVPPPDYYAVLSVPENATAQQIRDAYKRSALKNHPDRVPADSPERKVRTRKFQLANDAYYTLSDASRRKEYDRQRRRYGTSGTDYDASDTASDAGSTASWAWDYFSKATGSGSGSGSNPASGKSAAEEARQRAEDAQFADVFEEMLREEGMAEPETNRPTGTIWSLVGGLSGGAIGFIVANVPGMVAGAVAGNRLGAVRDHKGKSVYAVFQELPADDRARILGQLAVRVFSHVVGV